MNDVLRAFMHARLAGVSGNAETLEKGLHMRNRDWECPQLGDREKHWQQVCNGGEVTRRMISRRVA